METTNLTLGRKLRMGLVGGGLGSFIGRVHVTAAVLDNRAELVAGAFSSSPEKSKASAPGYAVADDRAYDNFEAMIADEAKRDDGVDFISITTPNHVHFPVAKAAIEAGLNVVCDKPMTFTLEEAEQLLPLVEKSGVVFALTHTYTGYPLVRMARQMCLGGDLGEVRAIRSNYIQGWLATDLESSGQTQAAWRTDPSKSGASGCFGDIGTHAYNLGRYMTGLLPEEVSCHLKTFVGGRKLDDYGHAVVRMANGALMTVTASQISTGRENDAYIEVDGTKGSFVWRQENPNELHFRENGQPLKTYTRDPNAPWMEGIPAESCRIPSGHPEGYFEAFANLYRFAYDDMAKRASGETFETRDTVYTNVYDGVEGMYFIQQCVASSNENGAWLPLKHEAARR